MADRLTGKIAVVTGAGNGIGAGCAEIFRREGATVIGADLSGADRDCDLLDEAAVTSLFDGIGAAHGCIDIVVNAAAFAHFAWIETMTYADWQATLRGELDIVFLATSAAWPWLKASGKASIINFASANARHALEGSPALAHSAGKGGVLATTRHLAADPGFEAAVLAKNMIKRLGAPEDIAWCAVWLASDEAGYVTGADIPVDAEATAW